METVFEITYVFGKGSRGKCRAFALWDFLRPVSLKKPNVKLDFGTKWFAAVVVCLLQEDVEWRELHFGAERGLNCEHMQALLGVAKGSEGGLGPRVLQALNNVLVQSGAWPNHRWYQGS